MKKQAPAPIHHEGWDRLGTVRKRLEKLGYKPVSAIYPYGWADEAYGRVTLERPPTHLISEHPAAVLGIDALVLRPWEDADMADRVRKTLERAGLLSGPMRLGSDLVELYPLQPEPAGTRFREVLEGAVALWPHTVIALDGMWPDRTLLEVSLAELPTLADADALFEELESIPAKLAAERAPPPKPSPLAFLGIE